MNVPVVVVDAGEAEGPPETLELVQVDAGELGHLDPGVAPARRDEHAVGDEEVDDAVGHRLVDLLVGGAPHEEGLADAGQRRLPARPRRRTSCVGRARRRCSRHVGNPRNRVSSHSGREGRSIRFISASAGEQWPSTMEVTCSAMGISTP